MDDSKNNDRTVSLKRRVFSLPTLVFFGIAVAFIFFLATRFDLDWAATWGNVRAMNPWLYVVGFLLYYVSFLFRGLRWRVLAGNAGVRSSPGARLPSAIECSQLIVIGWFANAVTWLRMGDAYRAYAFSHDSKGGFSWSLGTVLAERVVDMVTIFALLIVGVLVLSATTDHAVSRYILIAASAMAFALAGITLVMKACGPRLARFLPGRIQNAYERFHGGTIGSFKRLPTLLLLSLAGWILEIARLYFVVAALGFDINLALVVIVALGHAILSTVPTPGGVGAVEPGVTALLLIGLARDDAVSVALIDRSITYVSVIGIGGLVFTLRQMGLGRRGRTPSTARAKTERVAADS